MQHITATHINYLQVCQRKLWLFSHAIVMEHTSDLVSEGKLIGETSYAQRNDKYTEMAMDGIKIDFYDAKNKIIHETKKSDKAEKAHIAQVKYYIMVLERNGICGVEGIIEYPTQRKTERIVLIDTDRTDIEHWEADIARIVAQEVCPKVIHKPICKNCSYFDFCYSDE
jgi:CRISPR-associated exonuclease Cas4